MNRPEFSDEFTTLLDSYKRSGDFGEVAASADIVVDEYEKSVFLTEAQEDIIKEYYSGKGLQEPFEETEETRRALAELVIQKEITVSKASATSSSSLALTKDSSYIAELPKNSKGKCDVWYLIFESVRYSDIQENNKCIDALHGSQAGALVKPARHDELYHLLNNPFRGPLGNRVLRLDVTGSKVELISFNHQIAKYIIRYIKQPSPIILINLPEPLTIRGESIATECQLPTQLHQLILERAVAKAVRSKLTARTQS